MDGLFTSQGGIPSCHLDDYDFYKRYLARFSGVEVVARLFKRQDVTAKPVTGEGVTFRAFPGYRGPAEFLKHASAILPKIIRLSGEEGAFVLRIPSTLGLTLGVLLLLRGRPYGVEVIADPEDGYSYASLRSWSALVFRQIFVWGTRIITKNACMAAYVTASTLQKKYPNKERLREVSYTSLDLPDQAIIEYPRTIGAGATGRTRLLMVAAMQNYYKGHDIALHTLSLLIEKGLNVELVFLGDGPKRKGFESLSEELGLDKYVKFEGKRPSGEAVWKMMDDAHLLFHPSRQEGLPRVVIEAMARGLPCVASGVGGTHELLDEPQLVTDLRPSGYAKAIEHFLGNRTAWATASAENLQKARNYTVTTMSRNRLLFYNGLYKSTA